MDLSPAALFASILVSSAGYVLFSYGRKAKRFPHLTAGIVLFVVAWFAPTPLVSLAGGAGVGVLLWFAVRRVGL